MKELPLNFRRNDDATPVSDFSGNDIEAVSESIGGLLKITKEIQSKVKEGQEVSKEACAEVEKFLDVILERLNYQEIIEREKAEREVEISKVNFQNSILKKQLEAPIGNEDVREKLKNISDQFNLWWDIKGFGHISEIKFKTNIVELKLSGYIFSGKDEDGNKMDESARMDYFTNMGLEINGGRSSDRITFNENNIKIITDIIKSQFPKSYIVRIDTYFGRSGKPSIQDIMLVVSYEDIESLQYNKKESYDLKDFTRYDFRDKSLEKQIDSSISNLHLVFRTFAEMYNNKTLKKGFSETLTESIHSYTLDLLTSLKYEGKYSKLREDLYVEIRTCHQANRNLRHEIGNKISVNDVKDKIVEMSKKIEHWWGFHGLGYVSDIYFHSYGAKVNFSCLIADSYSDEESSTKEEKEKLLTSEGLEINKNQQCLADSEKSRDYIKNLIFSKFPTARFDEVKTDLFTLKNIQINIGDLDEII